MTGKDARARLAVPTLAMLPKIGDSLSFLYMDIVRVVQDDTGVCAQVETTNGTDTVYIPTAALSCVLLGPGTSITARALSTFARNGTTVVCVGTGGVRCYASIQPSSLTTDWLERQARAWADDGRRLDVAIQMYRKRFDDAVPPDVTLAQLRGMEGHRMKTLYRLLTQQHGVGRFRRNYDPDKWEDQDPLNLALSSANTCLYGVVHAAIAATGCSPALGFVHRHPARVVDDIADLYKAETHHPSVFSLYNSHNPEAEARGDFGEGFRLIKLMPTIVDDIQRLLSEESQGRTCPTMRRTVAA